jgi:hypothetical protein
MQIHKYLAVFLLLITSSICLLGAWVRFQCLMLGYDIAALQDTKNKLNALELHYSAVLAKKNNNFQNEILNNNTDYVSVSKSTVVHLGN